MGTDLKHRSETETKSIDKAGIKLESGLRGPGLEPQVKLNVARVSALAP